MRDHPKPIKRLLRELAAEAHERELHQKLARLDQSFAEWRSSQLTSGELSERIHLFHDGPSRELFNRYNSGQVDWCVARAIAAGILPPEEVPVEVLDALKDMIEFTRSQDSRVMSKHSEKDRQPE